MTPKTHNTTPIPCYYFNSTKNFGDILNKNLFEFYQKEIKAADIETSDIVAIGSLLHTFFQRKPLSIKKKIFRYFTKPILVYGSGFIAEMPQTAQAIRKLDVRAVRGYLTLEKLKQLKHVKIHPEIAVGDPGLLIKHMFDASKIQKKYALGIIPHYVDKESPLLKNIEVKDSIIIDIQQDPDIFLTQLSECQNIIASAMHGLIASDSLGIPNIRMKLSDNIIGGDYKYNDYYSAFGIKEHKIIDLANQNFTDKDLPSIAENYKISEQQVENICQKLIKTFPYKDVQCQ